MKTLFVVLSAFLALNAHAQTKKIWSCFEDGDVDWVRVEIYKIGAKTYAQISQVGGDGDDYGLDIIEVAAKVSSDEVFRTYVQVGTTTQKPRDLKEQPNHKVRGFTIRVPLIGSEGYYRATQGPIGGGFKNYLPMVCERVIHAAGI